MLLVCMHEVLTNQILLRDFNTYPVCLFVTNMLPDMLDRLHVCLYIHVRLVELLTINSKSYS